MSHANALRQLHGTDRTLAFAQHRVPRELIAFRMVGLALLVALFWKWPHFQVFDAIYAQYPLADPFFPAWLQSVWSLRVAFLGSGASIVLGIVTSNAATRRCCACCTFLCSTILVLHQGSYNDMTFATAWWTSLWSMWFAFQLDSPSLGNAGTSAAGNEPLLRRAAFLSRLIVSMILLGGAVGKWTGEYWSGEVFYEIYFADRDFWVFNWLRSCFDEVTLRSIATLYSRKVVLIESVAGFGLWLLPPRYAAAAGVLIFTSIAMLSNFLLFSVLLSLIGLAAVGFLVPRKPAC